MSDPLRTLWSALEARDCRPKGKAHDFRARCPVHGGDNPQSLHVSVGADGRAVLYCFARQCPAEEVCAALGLQVVDLFPDGHRNARRSSLRPVRRADFDGSALAVANVLYAFERLEHPWQLMLTSTCPYCGSPGAWLQAHSRGWVLPGNGYPAPEGRVDVDCPEGCDADNYVQALLALVADRKGRDRA
jgi:hypothetical protein